MEKKRGKLIVICGINNLGKTTQAKLLVKRLKKEGKKAEYLKYGIYDLKPAGQLLDGYLRKNNPYKFTTREFQILHVLNRTQYQPLLAEKLNKGINIVAEDYISTALAWGIGTGVKEDLMRVLNLHLIKEDKVFLLEGKRFRKGIEKKHQHEANSRLMHKIKRTFQKLAKREKWEVISANQSKELIQELIWRKVKKIL